MTKDVVLSGIRATGRLHFGSLLGAVNNFVRYQDDPEKECLYFVADWHTLTTLDSPDVLRNNLTEMVKDYLAAGLDPERSIIYAQSSVPQIAELSLYLSMSQPLGDLMTIPTYKELVRRNPERVTHGLLSYPVLMAADILGPQATMVPVGEDQRPNVELARNLAGRFNERFGSTFIIPEMMNEMVKVPGLDGGKMGKSDAANAIGINMSKDEVRERYKKRGITDQQRVRRDDAGRPEECLSVFPIHKLISPDSTVQSVKQQCSSAQIGCMECKELLVEEIWKVLEPFQQRRREYEDADEYVREVLHEGAKRAREIITPTVEEVADKMGIVRFVDV